MAQPIWSENEPVPQSGRENPFELSETQRRSALMRGQSYALTYPVEITGEVLPLVSTLKFFRPEFQSQLWLQPLRAQLGSVFQVASFSQLESMIGLIDYPENEGEGVYHVPFPQARQPWFKMGTSIIDAPEGKAITFSCAACHAGELFGKKVIGLTNRFPRANEFFLNGRTAARLVSPKIFQAVTKASDADTAMFRRLRENAEYIDGRFPLVRGLDTSLAHVALSLARREDDEWATKNSRSRKEPRDSLLRTQPADSKPAVWWNVKYKNKWLLDGSVVAGNPIFTNILWNEIGRGTDLESLSLWLNNNSDVIEDLTTAVFSSRSPEFLDFFPEEHFSLDKVREGAALYNQHCAFCHGTYKKGFELSGNAEMSKRELLKTVRVFYHSNTPVIDVGTDPLRSQGMEALADPLNRLKISAENGIVVKVQKGYVPPPLVGVWARWPYMHNNAFPDLCSILTPAALRPDRWDVGEAHSKETDFDSDCNGYPLGQRTPSSWKKNRWGRFDTRRLGMSNRGHDEGIVSENGVAKFSSDERAALIQYLQTL
jgi:mono/diheme cytochrome c family protein